MIAHLFFILLLGFIKKDVLHARPYTLDLKVNLHLTELYVSCAGALNTLVVSEG